MGLMILVSNTSMPKSEIINIRDRSLNIMIYSRMLQTRNKSELWYRVIKLKFRFAKREIISNILAAYVTDHWTYTHISWFGCAWMFWVVEGVGIRSLPVRGIGARMMCDSELDVKSSLPRGAPLGWYGVVWWFKFSCPLLLCLRVKSVTDHWTYTHKSGFGLGRCGVLVVGCEGFSNWMPLLSVKSSIPVTDH
jgi:hypothetical protein